MVFSSTVFIFLFLPLVLGIYFLLQNKLRNLFLLIASLFFYAWGEGLLVLLMMGSIGMNYIMGIAISESLDKNRPLTSKMFLALGVGLNLLVLTYYKYIHFLVENLAMVGIHIDIDISNVTLPIGISFFTFQSISYLVDVYRSTVKGQRSIVNLGMYIALFPQLIAGPIVRYVDISKEIQRRTVTPALFKTGITRFLTGFAKKIIIANNVGLVADKVFGAPVGDLSTSLTWIGVLCYTLQIYYDFSGYSDMAIGLGKMFGFNFKENFDHPYISKSVQEFWRRWHISLSTWFRDYLYIPLGGNRKGKYRTYVNLLIVFFLTGLWHGASWNFIVWGMFHGFFLIVERMDFFKLPSKFTFLKRFYLLLVVMVGWVIFRAENLGYALEYIGTMFAFTGGTYAYPYLFLNTYTLTVIALGILFSAPLRALIVKRAAMIIPNPNSAIALEHILYVSLFILSLLELAQTTYNPFIYFRF
ncbi:alginate O-acetyltransferase complex protein AlgI [Pricia antarctica]|uniref:Alginate O-acetyltransferase complex protein AlgI n=1 Tax=Pricia antarctica TaxID=641691 RepID=A0A1G6X3C5_9FLAO|nr:MBOAT family O-acyltransferase [Pricia antarctica]SDD71775.1 alginate O-acetyltransferase complex protein AlgI [Pricia antarctica]